MSRPSRYFQVHTPGPVTVVRFTEPNLNDATLQRVGEDLSRLADLYGGGELHLDFSRVRYINTGFMSRLLSVHRRVTQDGGHLVLKNLATLHDLFRVTRLDTLLDARRADDPGDRPSQYADGHGPTIMADSPLGSP
jgi:anti-anti-sigma regulatory factor